MDNHSLPDEQCRPGDHVYEWKTIGLAELRQLARLTSLRMWDAYCEVDVKRSQSAVIGNERQ